jgi:hypothetical protein
MTIKCKHDKLDVLIFGRNNIKARCMTCLKILYIPSLEGYEYRHVSLGIAIWERKSEKPEKVIFT